MSFWNDLYAASDQIWSGRPNHWLVDLATDEATRDAAPNASVGGFTEVSLDISRSTSIVFGAWSRYALKTDWIWPTVGGPYSRRRDTT